LSSDTRITTGQADFSYGVDTSRNPLIQSAANPSGLPRNASSWIVNGQVRTGGIQPRFGNKALCKVHDGNALYQGGIIYDNSLFGGNPYLLLSVGGRMYQVRVDSDNSVHDVTGAFADPADVAKCYWTQGEQFAIKQAGDGFTLPLFWDGFTLRRSNGQDFNHGVTSIAFAVPAVGSSVLVTLSTPFDGPTNSVLQVWDAVKTGGAGFAKYVQAIPANFYTIKNLSGVPTNVIPAGKALTFADGTTEGVLLAPFTVPAVGASATAFVTPAYTGALPVNVTLNGGGFQITATGAAAPGANQVYLVNLNDTQTAPTNIPVSTVLYGTRELPAATCMCYYMGRIWYAQNHKYTAGDIVDGPSGTVQYNFTDSILKVTENPLALSGDGFSVPGQSGNIRALNYPIVLDTALGQGPLFIFTPKEIYALTVPVSRTDWIAADSNNQPLQRVVQKTNGTVSDRSVVAVNGDLFFQSLDPGIRTYFMALRYFGSSWANPPISNNINRLMAFQDRGLMHVASGIEFNGRVYQAVLPVQTAVGIASTAIASLDTNPVSTLQDQKPPVWDGPLSGLDILELFRGDFGGLERAFAVCHNRIDGSIWVWELTKSDRFDTNTADTEVRVPMLIETPAWDWSEYPRDKGGGIFETKRLDGLDLWVDKVFGEVLITVEFRPDETTCWYPWATTKICAARTCAENVNTPACYPVTSLGEQYRNPISFPTPTNSDCQPGNNRPVTIGYKFQLRITIKGWCRLRGYQLHAIPFKTGPFQNSICELGASWMIKPPPQPFPNPTPFPPAPPPIPPTQGEVLGDPNAGDIFGSGDDQFGIP
jgi:hypothetical protein